jgi:hypothetical protein
MKQFQAKYDRQEELRLLREHEKQVSSSTGKPYRAGRIFDARTMTGPTGSNADEWHLFLSEHPGGLPYVVVQIAEAIDAARAPNAELLAAAKDAAGTLEANGCPYAAKRLGAAIAKTERSLTDRDRDLK